MRLTVTAEFDTDNDSFECDGVRQFAAIRNTVAEGIRVAMWNAYDDVGGGSHSSIVDLNGNRIGRLDVELVASKSRHEQDGGS